MDPTTVPDPDSVFLGMFVLAALCATGIVLVVHAVREHMRDE